MKKNLLWMLAAILCCGLTVTVTSACSSADDDGIGTAENTENAENAEGHHVDYNIVNVQATDSVSYDVIDLLNTMVMESSKGNGEEDEDYLRYAQNMLTRVRAEEQHIKDSIANVQGVNGEAFGEGWDGASNSNNVLSIKFVTLRYKARGADGSEKELSERLVWPYNAVTSNPNPKHLVIGCHATITSNSERPSNFDKNSIATDVGMLALFAYLEDALVVIPDYEGYGATHGSPHPYLDRDVTAHQVIEGAKAGVAWYEANQKEMDPDWLSVAVGYSQGGAVAAGVMRYYREHQESGLYLTGAVCGDGPYDPLATLMEYINENKLYMPVSSALILKGMVDTNPTMKEAGCTYRDFVTDDFYNTGIFDWLAQKNRTIEETQAELLAISCAYQGGFKMWCWSETDKQFMLYSPDNLYTSDGKKRDWNLNGISGKNYCTVDQCLKPDVIAYFKGEPVTGDVDVNKLKALEQALKENSLTYGGWEPNCRLTFFHSTRDEVVPYCNYESVKSTWGTSLIKGYPYASGVYLHIGTGVAFFAYYVGKYVNDILYDAWESGETWETGSFF